MDKKPKNQHVVRRSDGTWAVRNEGSVRDTANAKTQKEAIEKAREIARQQGSEVIIHGKDGRIRDRETYALPSQGWAVHTEPAKKSPSRRAFASSSSARDQRLTDRIVVSRDIAHGKPRIAGTRIMVHLILDLLAAGKSPEEVTSQDYYPELTMSDVYACIEYASRVVQNDEFAPT